MKPLQQLEDTVDQFCQFISSLPENHLLEQDWGPREVLAHIVYCHELYLHLIEANCAGKITEPPEGRFSDLNRNAVAASRSIPIPKLIDRLQATNQRLISLYQKHDPKEITVEIKVGAKPRTFAELMIEVEAHIRSHLKKLRKDHHAGAE